MKKKMVLVLGIVLILCLGIGGKFYMDRKEEQRIQILQAEKEIALYIIQNYEDVEKIEFRKLSQLKETGFWHVSADINDVNTLTFSMRNLELASNPTIGYNSNTFHLKEKSRNVNEDLTNIEIVYSEEK